MALNHAIYFAILLSISPLSASAQWQVRTEPLITGQEQETVAYVTNEDGYTLEIYRDGVMIRGRFILKEGLTMLFEDSCPSFLMDNGMAINTSADGSPCIQGRLWADYNFGEIENDTIVSPVLRALMEGNTLTFRFRLKDGNYKETNFGLLGSTRTITDVIGEQVSVRQR